MTHTTEIIVAMAFIVAVGAALILGAGTTASAFQSVINSGATAAGDLFPADEE